METHAEKASKAVKSAEKKLHNALIQPEIDYVSVEVLLEKYRVKCADLAFIQFFLDDSAKSVESRLWERHVEVNQRYKSWFKTFREDSGRKRHVEKRKAEKMYTDFVKASQRFYRAFIVRVAGYFTEIPKIQEIAQRLNKGSLPAQQQKVASEQMKEVLERSCEKNVIRLGDLSRWRETELDLKERNWGPAKGYYQLALSLNPGSGPCFNQLAVIALNIKDHIGTVFYTYRAIAAKNPAPTAPGNLRQEFEKISRLDIQDNYGLTDRSDDDDLTILEKKFLAFHTKCFREPADFVAFQQKASDILGQIAISFQEAVKHDFDHFLDKAVLINIAAEYMAREGMTRQVGMEKISGKEQAQETERNCQSYFLYQRLNIMTFQALLKILARELGDLEDTNAVPTGISSLSATIRRVLPHLRQYSSWFLSSMQDLVDSRYKSTRNAVEQLTKVYAQTLNTLRSRIDVFAPSPIAYLLDEDVQTLSFLPFSPVVHRWRYLAPGGDAKPKRVDFGNGKELSEEFSEAHLRATDLVVDALRIWKQKDELKLSFVPLEVQEAQFVALPIPNPKAVEAPPSPPKQLWRSKAHAQTPSTNDVTLPIVLPETTVVEQAMPAPPVDVEMSNTSQDLPTVSVSSVLRRMPVDVDNFTYSRPEPPVDASYPSSPQVGVHVVNGGKLTAMDIVRQMQRSPVKSETGPPSPAVVHQTSQSSLAGIYNTAFTPSRLEQTSLSPRVVSARKPSPAFATPQLSSSALFNDKIEQQKRMIEQRSSPEPSFRPTPTWTTFDQTPTGMNTLYAAFENHGRIPSPSSTRSVVNSVGDITQAQTSAPFGIIGQARLASRSPPSKSDQD